MDMYNKDQIFNFLRDELVSLFELEPESVTPEANLFEDLDVDSIDAVDLMVQLKQFTGKRIEPSEFKQVRTVQDVVDTVHALLIEEPETPDTGAQLDESASPEPQQG